MKRRADMTPAQHAAADRFNASKRRPPRRPRTVLERVRERVVVDPMTGCWIWQGGLDSGGYGSISVHSKSRAVHRALYEEVVGPVPDGLYLDHLCRNRSCANTEHLEPVTNGENVLRGVGTSAQNARKTHCIRSHEFTPANTRRRNDGSRACIACSREQSERRAAA